MGVVRIMIRGGYARRIGGVCRLLDETAVVDVSPAVLRPAGQPMPTGLGSLDAIHLSTAMLWAEHVGEDPVLFTHDAQLASAARASGLEAVGA